MDDLRYIYPVARVRVLEKYLLRKEVFLNLSLSDTLDRVLSIISESANYTSDILGIRDSADINTFINTETQRLEKLAKELFVEPNLFKAYLYLKKDLLKSYSLIMQTKSPFLQDFIKRFIDLYNIKTFLRIAYRRLPIETLKINLIEGGYIPKIEFINPVRELYLRNEIFSNGVKRFGKGWDGLYYEVIKDGIEQMEKEGSFSILERQIDNYLMSIMRPARYMFFGPEPVFGWCLAKEKELGLLKLILLAKINNISSSEIQQRLTLNYA